MKNNLNRLNVGRHDDKFSNSSVQSFCSFIGTLFELLVVRSLLDQIENLVRETCVSKRKGFRVGSGHIVYIVTSRGWITADEE